MIFKIREATSRKNRFFLGTASVVLVHLAWWLLTRGADVEGRYLSPQILPNPIEVLASFKSLYWERALNLSIAYSFYRITAGFFLAAAIAVPLGVLMGTFSKVRDFFQPLVTFGGYVPIVVLVPLTLSWFGLGEKQKIMFIALATFVILLPLIASAIDKVDDLFLQLGYTLGASRWQIVKEILIPSASTDIYDSLCLTYGIGWGYIILAEMIDARYGLGYLIITSQRRGPNEHIYAVIIVIVVISFLINYTLNHLGKWLFPYKD